jgi:transposase
MLSITPTVNVFLAIDPVDMRKGFHGLTSLTESILSQNPLSGHWFVFINRRRDRVKILTWDGSGFCIYYKRLERGTFELPRSDRVDQQGPDQQSIKLTGSQLSLILDGIELSSVRQRPRFQLQPTG